MKKVVIIGGPTGVGKSDLAFRLAAALGGELISCDSVQVFRGLEIGANKTPLSPSHPTREHLLDLVEWSQEFTVADFYAHCTEKIEQILKRNRIPILVGGTGFYLDWILRGRPGAPPTDLKIMQELELEMDGFVDTVDRFDNDKSINDRLDTTDTDRGGSNDKLSSCKWSFWWEKLRQVDPEYAQVILSNDFYRLKRALAVYRATGRPLSHFKRTAESVSLSREYDFRCFFITADREYICRNIDARCEEMLMRGLLQEVQSLKLDGFNTNCQAGRSIGYFESLNFLSKVNEVLSWNDNDNYSDNDKDDITTASASASANGIANNITSAITINNTTNITTTTTTVSTSTTSTKNITRLFLEFLNEFKSATRQYSRKQENWFASKPEFKWIRREVPFISNDTNLFASVHKAILAPREEYDRADGGWLAEEDSLARNLVNDRVRKRMKLYKSTASRFQGQVLEDFIKKLMKALVK